MVRLINLYMEHENERVETNPNMTPEAQAQDAYNFLSQHGASFHSLYTTRQPNDYRSQLLLEVLYQLIEVYNVLFPLLFDEPIHPEYLSRIATYLPKEYVIRAVRERRGEASTLLISYAETLAGRDPPPFSFENTPGATRLVAYIMSRDERLVFEVFQRYTRNWTQNLNVFTTAVYFRSLPWYKIQDEFEECVNPFTLLRRNQIPERVIVSCALDKAFFDPTFFLLFSGLYRLDGVILTPLSIVQNMTERTVYEPEYYRENPTYGIVPETVFQLGKCLNLENAQVEDAVSRRRREVDALRTSLDDPRIFNEDAVQYPELKEIITSYFHPIYIDPGTFVFSQKYLDSDVWNRRKEEFIRARDYCHGRLTPDLLRMITYSPLSYAKIKIDQGADFSDECVVL